MKEKSQQLDLDVDDAFQRREWALQRIGWIAWSVILVAAAVGLLGSGPLSQSTVQSPDSSLAVTYDRFAHYHQPLSLEVFIRPASGANNLDLNVSQAFLDAIHIDRIDPEPDTMHVTDDGAILQFKSSPETTNGKIIVYFEYERYGSVSGELRLADSEPVAIRAFVYP